MEFQIEARRTWDIRNTRCRGCYSYRAFLASVVRRGWGFHLHPVTPLSLKLDDSNCVQNYFGAGSVFLGKKNVDQIDNDVTMTSSLL